MISESEIVKKIENESNASQARYYFSRLRRKTRAICLAAAKRDGLALKDVPEDIRDAEIIDTALKSNGYALRFLKPEELSRARYDMAIESNSASLSFIPRHDITQELCYEAVRNRSMAIEYVPEQLQTYELCLMAVKDAGRNITHVSDYLIDDALCLVACVTDPWAVQYLTPLERTSKVAWDVVLRAPESIKLFSVDALDHKLCIEAAKITSNVIQYIPSEYKDNELYYAALKYSLCHIDEIDNQKHVLTWIMTEKTTADTLEIFKGRWIPKDLMPDFDVVIEFWDKALQEDVNNEELMELLVRFPASYKKRKAWLSRMDTN